MFRILDMRDREEIQENIDGHVIGLSNTIALHKTELEASIERNVNELQSNIDDVVDDLADVADDLVENVSTLDGAIKNTKTELEGVITESAATQKKYTDDSIAALVNSAPGVLDTLNELAAALGNDANFATTMTNKLATKVDNTTYAEDKAELQSNITDNATNISNLEAKHNNELSALKSELQGDIDTNATDISNLASTHETDKNAINQRIDNLENTQGSNVNDINQSINGLTSDVNTKLDTKVDKTTYTTEKEELSSAISSEQNRAQTAESALDARLIPIEVFFESAEINGDNNDLIDTLKEIQGYIASDKTGASSMLASIQSNTQLIQSNAQAIQTNANAIASKQDALIFDRIPTDGSENPVVSTGIKEYVDNSINGVQTNVTGYVDEKVASFYEGTAFILLSSTPDSTKKFAITVDDSGLLTATEIV